MDRKSIIVLIVSAILMLSWFKISERLFPPIPVPETPEMSTNATETNLTGTIASAPGSTNNPVVATTSGSPLRPDAETAFVSAKGEEETLVLTTADARYTFTSHGGGLKLVELTQYPESVGNDVVDRGNTPKRFATLNTKAPVPVLALLGGAGMQDDAPFKLTRTAKGVRAEKTLPNGLLLVKEFEPGSNYLVHATARLENHTGQPVSIKDQEWVIGTATPMSATDVATAVAFQWYNGDKVTEINQSWFANRVMGCGPSRPRENPYDAGESNVVWSGVVNQFFAMAAIPKTPALHVVSRNVKLPAPSAAEVDADSRTVKEPHGFQTALIYPGATLGTGEANNFIQRDFTLYAGPKEYKRLASLALQFENNLDLLMGFDTGFGGRFSGFFAKALLRSMNGLYSLGLSYALAIIAITVIIKLVFWPITQASTRSMKRMQQFQPQMKAIQEKYKDDPAKSQKKLMEFMKENKIPIIPGGCLPMLIQFPVFIGFFTMIRSAIELRGAQFLWAHDLSQPDTVTHFLNFPVNPLPIMMAATMLWQARLTPQAPGMDESQQKMMKYMPLMFVVFLYNFSAGLTLYYTVSNLLTIAQTKLTKTIDANAKPGAPIKPEAPPKRSK